MWFRKPREGKGTSGKEVLRRKEHLGKTFPKEEKGMGSKKKVPIWGKLKEKAWSLIGKFGQRD